LIEEMVLVHSREESNGEEVGARVVAIQRASRRSG
jgi:hypothetical protein